VSDSGSTVCVAVVAVALSVMLLSAACSWGGSNSRRPTTASRSAAAPPQWASYRQACESEGVCSGPPESISGSLPAKLIRPLHFPAATDARCPATTGQYVSTPDFGSWALGNGPVRIAVNNPGNLRHGTVHLATGAASGWLSLKTHFVSAPAYQGPFLVRTKRLDRRGAIRLGATPAQTRPLAVPAGPTPNGTDGRREIPYFTFVKAPGCYGWQIDGLTFSKIIVARVLPPLHS
jgi:hypothetical protein